ncbi:MAG: ATP synthase F1 subunit epsilon [Oscillospiraceae bacterium]
MQPFNLKIITSEGVRFQGEADSLIVRSVTGDVSIWAKHSDYVTALGIGRAIVTVNGVKRYAACNSGVLSVLKGEVTILSSTFEWQEDIDAKRAEETLASAKIILEDAAKNGHDVRLAKMKIQRALTRLDVKKM